MVTASTVASHVAYREAKRRQELCLPPHQPPVPRESTAKEKLEDKCAIGGIILIVVLEMLLFVAVGVGILGMLFFCLVHFFSTLK